MNVKKWGLSGRWENDNSGKKIKEDRVRVNRMPCIFIYTCVCLYEAIKNIFKMTHYKKKENTYIQTVAVLIALTAYQGEKKNL